MDTINTAVQAKTVDTNVTGMVSDIPPVTYKYAPYDAQLPIKVGEGMRLVKCLYKTNAKTGKAAGKNSYILVPEQHLSEEVMVENAALLAPYVAAFMQEQEDKLIKDHHVSGGLGFSDSWLSLQKILEALDSAGQGNRLNKEKIETWFASDMEELLLVAFADKMGVGDSPTEAEMQKLAEITGVYRTKFASLASGKTTYRKEEAELLQRALDVTGLSTDGNLLGARFYARLESMKTVQDNSLLMAL